MADNVQTYYCCQDMLLGERGGGAPFQKNPVKSWVDTALLHLLMLFTQVSKLKCQRSGEECRQLT